MLDSSQEPSAMHPQSHAISQQMTRNHSQSNLQFSQPPHHPKFNQLEPQSGLSSELSGHVGSGVVPINNQPSAVGRGQSAVTDDVPSCSTSPSTNNCPSAVQSIKNHRNHRGTTMRDEISQSSFTLLNSSSLEPMHKKPGVKPSLNISKSQNQGFFASQFEYLDSSSSATSVLSQNDGQLPQNNSMSFNSQSMLSRDASQDVEVHGDKRDNVPFGINIDNQLGIPMMSEPLITRNMVGSGKDFSTDLSSGGGILSTYENPTEAQPEPSSSMVSQSFGVPDMTFDSTINDGSFMNGGGWVPPQIPRMRTYTKVGVYEL